MTGMEALPEIVTQHLDDVRALCEKYRVKRLAIFGSAVKGTFDPATSDLDFVVEFQDEVKSWHEYFDLKFALSRSFRTRRRSRGMGCGPQAILPRSARADATRFACSLKSRISEVRSLLPAT